MYACNPLLKHGGIPRHVKVNDQAGGLKVESGAAGVGREKYTSLGVSIEILGKLPPFGRWHSAMEIFIFYSGPVEFFGQYTCHPFPLAENDGFFVAAFYHGQHELEGFAYFGVEAGFLVKNEGAVAHHTHLAECKQKALAVFFGEKPHGLPFVHQLGYRCLVLVVYLALLARHRHEEYFICALGQLKHYVGLAAADKAVLKPCRYIIELCISGNLP